MRQTFRQSSAPVIPIKPLFVTPLIDRQLALATPDFLAAIKRHVLEMEQRDQGRNVSNFGGWHSSGEFFDQDVEIVQQLGNELLKIAAEMTYEQAKFSVPNCVADVSFYGGSWANVSRNGDYNKPHSHPGSIWSGVFYVDLGQRAAEPADNGWIEFMDPRGGNAFGGKVRVSPRPGQVLLFPSWLHHYVNPFRGTGERISIAFNTNADVFPVK